MAFWRSIVQELLGVYDGFACCQIAALVVAWAMRRVLAAPATWPAGADDHVDAFADGA